MELGVVGTFFLADVLRDMGYGSIQHKPFFGGFRPCSLGLVASAQVHLGIEQCLLNALLFIAKHVVLGQVEPGLALTRLQQRLILGVTQTLIKETTA